MRDERTIEDQGEKKVTEEVNEELKRKKKRINSKVVS
jgi:hypothetical protein